MMRLDRRRAGFPEWRKMMLSFKKILCPTDFSGASRVALAAAAEVAAQFQSEIFLVHVVPVVPPVPPDPNFVFEVPEYERALHADADRQLKALADELTAKGRTVHTIVGHGDAGSEIVRVANGESVDLIVISTHGMTGWRHVVFGSVAEKVVRLAHRPVLTVPAPRE
jgi:nucleotide-binding universal stress UspA family protein